MPVFSWKGLDLTGKMVSGVQCARSHADLAQFLLKKHIGLVHASPSSWRRITKKNEILKHLFSLLKAHIPLYTALSLIAKTQKDEQTQIIVADCAAFIAEGGMLHEILMMHEIIDPFERALLSTGEKTGDMISVLSSMVEQIIAREEFKKKVRSALLAPFITFVFFIVIVLILLIYVIPRFEGYFIDAHISLSSVTHGIFIVSNVVRSWYIFPLSVFFIGIISLICAYAKNLQKMLCMLPYIKSWYSLVIQGKFYRMMALLMKHAIPVGDSLKIIENVMYGDVKHVISTVRQRVEAGGQLSNALEHTMLCSEYSTVYLAIGESSGILPHIVEQIAFESEQQIHASLNRFVVLIQPLITLFLGGLIAVLMCSIYMPLISLGQHIAF